MEDEEIKYTVEKKEHRYNWDLVVTVGEGYEHTFFISCWPTGNCQVKSIAYMDSLLNKVSTEQAVKMIKDISTRYAVGDRLYLIDVKKKYADKVREMADNIKIDQVYESPNGSMMHLFLITLK